MITKKVNRYYCEFCGKGGQAASHMSRHEKSCTLNPNRICRVCKMDHGDFVKGEAKQAPIANLIALLPKFTKEEIEKANQFDTENSPEVKAVNMALPAVREASGNCPACIMAALRQARIPVPIATDFHFTSEMKDIWSNINDANNQACGY